MKNRKLIRTLKKERRKLYPYGFPLAPRGCQKIYLHMFHVLRYITYYVVCDFCKHTNEKMTLEDAHKIMDDYINMMWEEVMK